MCSGANDGRWTCPACTTEVNCYRELIRNLQAWHSLFESQDASDVLTSGGRSFSMWDVDLFFGARTILPEQMRLGIELCLYRNLLERQAAVLMGIAPTNPVSIYATVGLSKMLHAAHNGTLPGYRLPADSLVAA